MCARACERDREDRVGAGLREREERVSVRACETHRERQRGGRARVGESEIMVIRVIEID